MAVAYRSSANSSASAASVAVAKPTGAAQGDIIVVAISSVSGSTITPPAGWTQLGTEQVDATVRTAFFWRLVGGSDGSTYTFTSSAAVFMDSVQAAYSGTKLFVSGSAVSKAATSTTFTTSALTTQFANAMVVTAFVTQLNAITWTPPSGMTERQDANGMELNDVVQASAGTTGTKTATASVSTDAAYLIVTLEESPSISASSGSYSVTGSSVTLTYNRVLSASPGSYSVMGASAVLAHNRTMGASSGSYSVTGSSASLLAHRVLSASAGSYSVTGASASLVVAHRLNASAGSYTVTGSAASLLIARLLSAQAGSYAVTGSSANLLLGFTMSLDAGSYAITGSSVQLLMDRVLAAASGSYAVTGDTVTMVVIPVANPTLTVFATWEPYEVPVPLSVTTPPPFLMDLAPTITGEDLTPPVPLSVLSTWP